MSTDIPPVAAPGALGQSVHEALHFPLPGSPPATVHDVARQLSATAKVLRAALLRVDTLGRDTTFWVGEAATAFATKASKAPDHIKAVADRYDAYAVVLTGYARSVEQSRSAVARRRTELSHAWSAYTRAQAAVAAAQPPAPAIPAPYAMEPVPAVDPHRARLASSVSTCRDDVLDAHARLRACYVDWAEAARVAGTKLHSADDHNVLQNPQGMHALVNEVAAVANEISTKLSIAGLVLMVFCPALAPLAFAIAAAAATVKTGADLDRRFQYGENVTGWEFADDALGMVPASGFAKAGKEGVTALKEGRGALRSVAKVGGRVVAEAAAPLAEGGQAAARAGRGVARGYEAVRSGEATRTAQRAVGRVVADPLAAGARTARATVGAVVTAGTNVASAVVHDTETVLATFAGSAQFGSLKAAEAVKDGPAFGHRASVPPGPLWSTPTASSTGANSTAGSCLVDVPAPRSAGARTLRITLGNPVPA